MCFPLDVLTSATSVPPGARFSLDPIDGLGMGHAVRAARHEARKAGRDQVTYHDVLAGSKTRYSLLTAI
jgi:hypothetical protein